MLEKASLKSQHADRDSHSYRQTAGCCWVCCGGLGPEGAVAGRNEWQTAWTLWAGLDDVWEAATYTADRQAGRVLWVVMPASRGTQACSRQQAAGNVRARALLTVASKRKYRTVQSFVRGSEPRTARAIKYSDGEVVGRR